MRNRDTAILVGLVLILLVWYQVGPVGRLSKDNANLVYLAGVASLLWGLYKKFLSGGLDCSYS